MQLNFSCATPHGSSHKLPTKVGVVGTLGAKVVCPTTQGHTTTALVVRPTKSPRSLRQATDGWRVDQRRLKRARSSAGETAKGSSLVGKCPIKKLMPISELRASADRHVSRRLNDLTKITAAADQPRATKHMMLRLVLSCYYEIVIAGFSRFAVYCAKTVGNGRVFE
jgi:hypothetical protein